jgi:hypothetical protein
MIPKRCVTMADARLGRGNGHAWIYTQRPPNGGAMLVQGQNWTLRFLESFERCDLSPTFR